MADDHQDDDTKDKTLPEGGGLSPEEVLLAAIRRSRSDDAASPEPQDMPDLDIPEPELPASVFVDAPPPEPEAPTPAAHRMPMIDRPASLDIAEHAAQHEPRPNPFVYAAPVVPRRDPAGTGFEFSVQRRRPGGR